MNNNAEHPFAEYIRILGRGKHTARSLTRDEAREAFTLVLEERVLDIQLGAFLMLLRVKGEDEQEMAGFAEAACNHINAAPLPVDIDWPSYAGKSKQQSWYILAALLLAANNHRIFMHSSSFTSNGRLHAIAVLQQLGVPACKNRDHIMHALQQENFAFATLDVLSPSLDRLFSHRPELGVRSPVNSLVKLINPFRAATSLQGVFHPAYLEIHQKAALLLGHRYSLVMKGDGGEIEFRPDADNRLFLLQDGVCSVAKWLRRQPHRQPDLGLPQLDATSLKNFWKNGPTSDTADSYELNAVLGTAAVVLSGSGIARDEAEAWQLASRYWQQRNRNRFDG